MATVCACCCASAGTHDERDEHQDRGDETAHGRSSSCRVELEPAAWASKRRARLRPATARALISATWHRTLWWIPWPGGREGRDRGPMRIATLHAADVDRNVALRRAGPRPDGYLRRAAARPARRACTHARLARRFPGIFRWHTACDYRLAMVLTDHVVAVDVGASTISAGLVCASDGAVVEDVQAPATGGNALDTITAPDRPVLAAAERRGLRVGGHRHRPARPDRRREGRAPVDTGRVAARARRQCPCRACSSQRTGHRVFVDNDVNALALAEWMFGAGRGASSLVTWRSAPASARASSWTARSSAATSEPRARSATSR